MGNKMCGSRGRAVAERLTRPQRLLRQPSDLDYKKLRKLILARKLAPCFDPIDDPQLAAGNLEECPICFLVIFPLALILFNLIDYVHLYVIFVRYHALSLFICGKLICRLYLQNMHVICYICLIPDFILNFMESIQL